MITQTVPTMYFFGVTTGKSSSARMFPRWAELLGLKDAQLVGVDLPINAPPEPYRAAVEQIKADPLSLGATTTACASGPRPGRLVVGGADRAGLEVLAAGELDPLAGHPLALGRQEHRHRAADVVG